jgi:hypothetical protein
MTVVVSVTSKPEPSKKRFVQKTVKVRPKDCERFVQRTVKGSSARKWPMAGRTADLGMSFRGCPDEVQEARDENRLRITKVRFRRSGRVWKQYLPNSEYNLTTQL